MFFMQKNSFAKSKTSEQKRKNSNIGYFAVGIEYCTINLKFPYQIKKKKQKNKNKYC